MSIPHDRSSAYDSPQSGFSNAQPELTSADAVPQTEILRVSCVANARDTATTDQAATEIIERIRADRTLAKLITRIRDKYWHVMDSTNGDRKAAKTAITDLKKALPAVMWSGTFTLRKKDALLQHSGLLCADLDELGREKIGDVSAKLRQSLFLWALFVSPTADGLKAVFRVRANPADHEASFRAVEQHVFELTGVEIDKKCSDVSRLCFLSHDPDVHLNESARELLPLIETETKVEQVPVAAVSTNGELRRGITEGLFGEVAWNTPTSGYVTCPGQHLHTSADGERDCEVYLDNVPTLHCFHESCLGIVAGVNHELRSRIAKSENGGQGRGSGGPMEWFNAKFPSLSEEYGEAVLIRTKDGSNYVGDISEDFLAATLSEKGTKDSPTVFVPTEQKFYMYAPGDGIYNYQRDADLITSFSKLLLDCAREAGGFIDTRSLKFRLRSSSKLSGVLKKAQGVLAVPDDFFSTRLTEFIPCANGMLRLSDKVLLPFSPTYRRRNKLAVPFDPNAKCPVFLDTLMQPALNRDELELLQRWCGLALVGENLAQRFLILSGTAGGGKGTFVRVLVGIIGQNNVATLRTKLLNERFELGRFLGKTLLYGADVPENFLNQRGASVIKSLTGYDPVTLEFKQSNESPLVICAFNALVTCNSRLTVHLEGDTEAWRRRLAIVNYSKPKPDKVIADLDKQILASEASGVLNWMIEGLDKVRADGWQLQLTAGQQKIVDDLLLESESHNIFAKEALFAAPGLDLTIEDCYNTYIRYCGDRGWITLPRHKFSQLIADTIARTYGLTIRHDIRTLSGMKRGWTGIHVQCTDEEL